MMDNAIEVKGLRKNYKGFSLRNVSFVLPQGTIMGLVGPNGAGKTTIIKLILNLVRKSGGEIRVFGLDHLHNEAEIKSRIGFVHESPAYIEDATLNDLKAAIAPFYGKWNESLFRSLLAEFELPADKKFKKLSHGMKMKFQIALALSHDADLLIMDEPTSGLDPVFRRELLERLSALMQDERKSVLFSTHITSDLERTADYITFVHEGEIVLSKSRDEIKETWAVVKGPVEQLTGERRILLKGIRTTAFGFEGLTGDIPAARRAFGSAAVIDRASIEDIMIFMDRGNNHA